MKNTSLYFFPAETARECGELDTYRASFKANVACKEAIEKAIPKHYANNRLDGSAAVNEVVSVFGYQRVFYVLANTVQVKDWDARFSAQNKAWAKRYVFHEDPDYAGGDRRRRFVVDQCHPGLTDLFITAARMLYADQEEV